MNIQEWVTRFDHSTLNDIPDTAHWMAESERLHMWAYPEPDYSAYADGTTMILAAWYIETSFGRYQQNLGGSIFMGSDDYHYIIDTDDNE